MWTCYASASLWIFRDRQECPDPRCCWASQITPAKVRNEIIFTGIAVADDCNIIISDNQNDSFTLVKDFAYFSSLHSCSLQIEYPMYQFGYYLLCWKLRKTKLEKTHWMFNFIRWKIRKNKWHPHYIGVWKIFLFLFYFFICSVRWFTYTHISKPPNWRGHMYHRGTQICS